MSSASTPNAQANTEEFEFAALQEANNYRQALLADFSGCLQGQVLEVGAGIGQFSRAIKNLPSVKRLLSIEPDPKFLPRLRTVLPEEDIIAGTVSDAPPGLAWDAIVNINVLEHIEADERELTLYRALLSPQQGHLCLFVPARPEIYGPIDKDFGHFRRYTKPELRAKLEKAGFEILTLRYYNSLGYFAWWLNFRVLKQRGFARWAVRFYDRVAFPVVRWAERHLGAPPFGQSLLAIARARPVPDGAN